MFPHIHSLYQLVLGVYMTGRFMYNSLSFCAVCWVVGLCIYIIFCCCCKQLCRQIDSISFFFNKPCCMYVYIHTSHWWAMKCNYFDLWNSDYYYVTCNVAFKRKFAIRSRQVSSLHHSYMYQEVPACNKTWLLELCNQSHMQTCSHWYSNLV